MTANLAFTTGDRDFTINWWKSLCKDEAAMNLWLQKLQYTEMEGYYDNLSAIVKYRVAGQPVGALLEKTARDEKRHADILSELLKGRNLNLLESHTSIFWSEMDKIVTDVDSMCSVFHLGEALAAFRFEVMLGYKGTPEDIKRFIYQALPDEQYHARGFRMHTTDETLSKTLLEYKRVVALMKK